MRREYSNRAHNQTKKMTLYIEATNNSSYTSTLSLPDFPNSWSPETPPIVTDDVRAWIESLLNALILLFGCLGVATNGINIRVFIQQGVTSDSSTISLFALAVSDFLGCVLLIPSPLCEVFKYTSNDWVVLTCITWFTLICPIPHIAMSRLTCWITVYIAVERSVCVLIPLRAKLLIRPRFTMGAMIFLYVVGFWIYLPLYLNTGVKSIYSSSFNSTLAVYTETNFAKIIRNYMSLIFNTVMSTAAVIIVAIATGLMLYKLNKYKKWREKSTSSANRDHAKEDNPESKSSDTTQGRKEVELLKMVVMVTGLFLVCLSMSHFPGFASALVPGFSVTGANRNLFYILYLYKFVFDLVNSSLNFFFYIRVSSRYITAYDEVFKKK